MTQLRRPYFLGEGLGLTSSSIAIALGSVALLLTGHPWLSLSAIALAATMLTSSLALRHWQRSEKRAATRQDGRSQ